MRRTCTVKCFKAYLGQINRASSNKVLDTSFLGLPDS